MEKRYIEDKSFEKIDYHERANRKRELRKLSIY
jgi:hypothetical protein